MTTVAANIQKCNALSLVQVQIAALYKVPTNDTSYSEHLIKLWHWSLQTFRKCHYLYLPMMLVTTNDSGCYDLYPSMTLFTVSD